MTRFQLPDDFDREAVCRSISDGVYRAIRDMIEESTDDTPGNAILNAIETGVYMSMPYAEHLINAIYSTTLEAMSTRRSPSS